MAKTISINFLENSIVMENQQEAENKATLLTVDFTGAGVDTWAKWVDYKAADGTGMPVSLGLGIIATHEIPAAVLKKGMLFIQAYAMDGDVLVKGKVFGIQVNPSLNITTNTTEYDPTLLGTFQQALSDMEMQIDEIYDAYLAEENHNAFSNVKVGSTTIASTTKTDTFELVAGLNVSIAVDALTNKITLSATGDLATEAVQSYLEDIGNYFTSLNVEDALQEVGLSLKTFYERTLNNGTKSNLPISPQVSDLFFLTDSKKRIEFNGTNWQSLDGSPAFALDISDANIYSQAIFSPVVFSSQQAINSITVDITKDAIAYCKFSFTESNDYMHISFMTDANYKFQVTFGYNWVTSTADSQSIAVYDYSDASSTLLGAVNFFNTPHDVIVWYDHKWGYINVYVDNVLIGSWKPISGGSILSSVNRIKMETGNIGTGLVNVQYAYTAYPLMTAIGDSITAGATKHAPNPTVYVGIDDYSNGYPKLISDYLKLKGIHNYFVVNKGVNSDTTLGMASRFTNDILNTGCKYVMIHGGINDYTTNDVDATVINKKGMANTAIANGIEPFILGVLPTKVNGVSTSHQYSIDLHLAELAGYGNYNYCDLWKSIEGSTSNVADDGKMDDTVHPNAMGYVSIANEITSYISGNPLHEITDVVGLKSELDSKSTINNPVFTGTQTLPSIVTNGIKFPATQVPSADANTLDDYEEGTFTPYVSGSVTSGTATYDYQVGKYTKIGNTVHFSLSITYSAFNGTGALNIAGLPFLIANVVNNQYAFATILTNYGLSANCIGCGYGTPNTSYIKLTQMTTGTVTFTNAPIDAGAGIIISGSYQTM